MNDEQVSFILKHGEHLVSKSETFIKYKYNDLDVIYRAKDMYVNATKLCVTQNKDIRTLIRSKFWTTQIIPVYSKYIQDSKQLSENPQRSENDSNVLFYTLDGGYREFQGYYVHPKLLNKVAEYCSVEYGLRVSEIMDNINYEICTRNITLTQKLDEQKQRIDELEYMIHRHDEGKLMIEGDIELVPFPGSSDKLLIYVREIKQVIHEPDHRYISCYNPDIVYNSFKYYIKHGIIDTVTFVVDRFYKNLFGGDIDVIADIITQIKNNEYKINKTIQELNNNDLNHILEYKHEKIQFPFCGSAASFCMRSSFSGQEEREACHCSN